MYSRDEQTIIAQCTPRGSGAIALIRISGATAFTVADSLACLARDKQLASAPTHTIHYGTINRTDGSIVDSVLFMVMRAPRTFTGQDTVEITCHNNQFIIEEIIALAIAGGVRLAQEGEFTRRAVLSGKIDMIQAEAINELIHAQTQLSLKQSLAQLEGSFSAWTSRLEKELLKALALCQASFEFLDEEMEFAPQINTIIKATQQTINEIKKTYTQQQQIRQGIRIALIGSVNAGKSSLFNTLLNQNRAIVNAQAGTTRDAIEAGLYKGGNYWTLVDTAGLRNTHDCIEQEGIRRSFEEAHKADIIILAQDGSRPLSPAEQTVYQEIEEKYAHKIIPVFTKGDTHTEPLQRATKSISVSSHTRENIGLLEEKIEEKIASLFADIASPFLLNQRQYNLLLALEKKLNETNAMLCDKSVAYELLSIHLNDAISFLAELSGRAISEAGMDMVFREFCVGK